MVPYISNIIQNFRRTEKGATAVEFAIVLPVMLATFGAMVESGRIYWNYQSAVTGVRDATRFLTRVTPEDICTSAQASYLPVPSTETVYTTDGSSQISFNVAARGIVERHLSKTTSYTSTGAAVLPSYISLPEDSVAVSFACITSSTGTFRTPFVPIIRVDATVQIDLPFANLFTFFGDANGSISSTITDQSRVMGL